MDPFYDFLHVLLQQDHIHKMYVPVVQFYEFWEHMDAGILENISGYITLGHHLDLAHRLELGILFVHTPG